MQKLTLGVTKISTKVLYFFLLLLVFKSFSIFIFDWFVTRQQEEEGRRRREEEVPLYFPLLLLVFKSFRKVIEGWLSRFTWSTTCRIKHFLFSSFHFSLTTFPVNLNEDRSFYTVILGNHDFVSFIPIFIVRPTISGGKVVILRLKTVFFSL